MVKLPQHEGIHHHAKKEKRITGGIPEEKPCEVVIEIEIEGGAGKIEPTSEAQGFREQQGLVGGT